jgi:hypothetical protein
MAPFVARTRRRSSALNVGPPRMRAAARFADTGWEDSHTAAWTVAGSSISGTLSETTAGPPTGKSTTAHLCRVHPAASRCGHGGDTTTQNFNVTVVPDDPQRLEPNDAISNAPELAAGGSYLSYVQSQGDVDIYEIVLPGNSPLPAGSEVLLSLQDLPADFDLVALTSVPAGTHVSRFAQSDFGQVGFNDARFAQSRFAQSRFAQSRFAQSRFAQSRFAQSAFNFGNLPLSGVSGTGLDGEQIGGTDISLEELGLGSIAGTNVEVAGFSANRGLDNETPRRSGVAGTRSVRPSLAHARSLQLSPRSRRRCP